MPAQFVQTRDGQPTPDYETPQILEPFSDMQGRAPRKPNGATSAIAAACLPWNSTRRFAECRLGRCVFVRDRWATVLVSWRSAVKGNRCCH
jgi:hypothetical protein